MLLFIYNMKQYISTNSYKFEFAYNFKFTKEF